MIGESTTGPLILGRWSQPAALTNAGFIPPDPYPLEKILFCATCGQQFFGTHLTSGTDQPCGPRAADGIHVADAHQSGDTHVLGHIRVTGTHLTSPRVADGTRVYRTSCDCRPGPLPAHEVELRVHAEAHVHAFDTDTVAGLTGAHYAVLAVRLFSRAEVGSTADEITFTARI
jgi:hypothetical protein